MTIQNLGRNVQLRVYATALSVVDGVPQIEYDKGYTLFSSVLPDGREGFRIKGRCVQVQPTVGFNTNQITLDLYNLGATSRAITGAKVGTKIEIFAGYGQNPKQIALGDILWARTVKKGGDFITSIIAGDSHFALTNNMIQISFEGQVSYATVVNVLLAKLQESSIFSAVINVPDGGYTNGITLNGSAMTNLADVCKKMNRTMSIVGGGVFILPPGQDSGAPEILISEATGMYDIPEVQPPGVIGVVPAGVPVSPDNDVAFKHQLRAELVLSQRVRINSKFIKGSYVIGRNVFEFDSWQGPFENQIEAFKVVTNVGS